MYFYPYIYNWKNKFTINMLFIVMFISLKAKLIQSYITILQGDIY